MATRTPRPVSFDYACKLVLTRSELARHANHPRLGDYARDCLVRVKASATQYRLYTVVGRGPDASAPYQPNPTGAYVLVWGCGRHLPVAWAV